MSRILKRPMFRRGGAAGEGIMSGITDRANYENGGIDLSGINKERLRGSAASIQSLLNEFAPVPKTRLPYGDYGINLALGMDPVEALRDPYAKFTKADDIRRAQLAKRGQGAVSTALQLELARLKQKPKEFTKTLSKEQVKEQFPGLPEGSIVQVKPDGEFKITKPDAASVKKVNDLKSTIGLLNKAEKNYLALNKPVGGVFGVGLDPDRIRGQIGRFTGSKAGTQYASLLAQIDAAQTFLTQAISGAQVSDQEAERIKKLIPQITDTEVVFEAKLKSLRSYLAEAAKNYGGDVEALMKAGDVLKGGDANLSAQNFLTQEIDNLDKLSDEELETLYNKLKEEQDFLDQG
tara:strand:- start:1888 stop:2934 length:1047 start_codon:yes stop_codon:yes gene_type:complete